MSEEEKGLVEKFQNLYIKEFNNEPITSDDRLSYIECALITNLIEELDKELNTLKEIEQLHQEENGKLRVELKQEKEKNKELTKQLNGAFDRGFISKDKIKSVLNDVATIMHEQNELDYEDITDTITEVIDKIKKQLLEEK